MMSPRRQRLRRELQAFLLLTAYFTLFLGSFTIYQRILLAQAGIAYLHYGIALIEGAVLAKLLLIAEAIHLGERFRRGPLALNVLLLSLGSTGFILLAGVVEHLIRGLVQGRMPLEVLRSLPEQGPAELVARMTVLIIGLIPLFAFLEIGRAIGFGRLGVLLFSRRNRPGRRSPKRPG